MAASTSSFSSTTGWVSLGVTTGAVTAGGVGDDCGSGGFGGLSAATTTGGVGTAGFATAAISPPRNVPVLGHVTVCWIRDAVPSRKLHPPKAGTRTRRCGRGDANGTKRAASRQAAAEADAALAGVRFRDLTVGGLTANGRDRDMPHRRIGLGAMPMAFTSLDVHDITHVDLTLFVLRRHHAGARRHDQDLIAVMRMPPRRAALAEVHHAAIIVRGVPGLNDRLT